MDDAGNSKLLRATPVLKTGDYKRARNFYTDVLGFRLVEEGGDPPRFGIFDRDSATVFLDGWHGAPGPSDGGWVAYFHTGDIDALHLLLAATGTPITRPLEDTGYGMREFEVTDPDGNILCFGAETETDDWN